MCVYMRVHISAGVATHKSCTASSQNLSVYMHTYIHTHMCACTHIYIYIYAGKAPHASCTTSSTPK